MCNTPTITRTYEHHVVKRSSNQDLMADSEANNSSVPAVIRLPPQSVRVTDADEEVFLLYTQLAARSSNDGSSGFRGLGHIDSHEDVLTISLKLGTNHDIHDDAPPVAHSHSSKRHRSAHKRKIHGHKDDDAHTLDVEIFQDKTALRSRKGDTGSVLWHASVDFAQVVLQQLHRKDTNSFLDAGTLSASHVLELGAGTGLLSVVLSPFVRHYTVTDIAELVPLIRKNIERNLSPSPTQAPASSRHRHTRSPPQQQQASTSNVTAVPLDWVQLQNAPSLLRKKIVPEEAVDLLLVVDCIYHPSLLPALLTTMDSLAIPGKTVIVVVVELRAEDVVREFLQGWLNMTAEASWEIWSVNELLDGPYAVWVGWKHEVHS